MNQEQDNRTAPTVADPKIPSETANVMQTEPSQQETPQTCPDYGFGIQKAGISNKGGAGAGFVHVSQQQAGQQPNYQPQPEFGFAMPAAQPYPTTDQPQSYAVPGNIQQNGYAFAGNPYYPQNPYGAAPYATGQPYYANVPGYGAAPQAAFGMWPSAPTAPSQQMSPGAVNMPWGAPAPTGAPQGAVSPTPAPVAPTPAQTPPTPAQTASTPAQTAPTPVPAAPVQPPIPQPDAPRENTASGPAGATQNAAPTTGAESNLPERVDADAEKADGGAEGIHETGEIPCAIPILQLSTNRNIFRLILLSVITVLIYPIFYFSSMTEDLNIIASRYDGKRTLHFLLRPILMLGTLGIGLLVTNNHFCARVRDESRRRGLRCSFGPHCYWIWQFTAALISAGACLGLYWYFTSYWCFAGLAFFAFGAFVYQSKLARAMNRLCKDYNRKG